MKIFAIVVLTLGILLTVLGFVIPSMYWATVAGPGVNIFALGLLAFSLYREPAGKSAAH